MIKFSLKVLIILFIQQILILNSSGHDANATCIIIYIGNGEVLIGADSRNVKKDYNSDSLQFIESCKIKKFNSLFCAMSGFTNSLFYDFNPYQIAEKYLSTTESFDSQISKFNVDIKARLSEILKKIKTNPKSWQMVVTRDNRILDVGLIGVINGRLGVYRLGFILTDKEDVTIDIQEEMIVCTESTNKYTGFGDSEKSKDYITNYLKTETPERIIVNAIKAQSSATPMTVGVPISLLRVKADSFDWLIRGGCDD